ncbi:MOSC domain-containing protein [Paenibacillus lutrae]|uniref:MOSC domain-containing protein n=1 Tax=Paenibacillus lutrae TaxID=2078573 RepID=A0A7X3K162_9BACL|nr:MOSC domain-containing protein [Paenibacillus lutrae]MVP01822.1 MOSC domain-containing protein [Paenibacillus lutrae]
MSPKIVSVNVGKPKTVLYRDKHLETGIYKNPVSIPLYLSKVQLDGDGQADLAVHGGPDKALCVYSTDHYSYWEELLGPLSFGAFGENISVEGLTEKDTCIGDIYELGEALVQVSQPRRPCFKLGYLHDNPKLPLIVQETGYTGFYLRVLREGWIPVQPAFTLVERHSQGLSVDFVNRCKYSKTDNFEDYRTILSNEALAESWRGSFEKKLAEADQTVSANADRGQG